MDFMFEYVFLSRDLFQSILTPICTEHNLTQAELIVLMYLAQNPEDNTAADVVKSCRLTKSAVSMAARALEEKGFVKGEFLDGNHRSIHLKVCSKAKAVIKEGRKAQDAFCEVVTEGFADSEKDILKDFFGRISLNIKNYNNLKAVNPPQK